MTKIVLLDALKSFTEETVKDLLLPVQRQEDDEEEPAPRVPTVYRGRLPELRSYASKAPFIVHEIVTGEDVQSPGMRAAAGSAVVRTVFCVYHEDEQEGVLALLNVMERLRIALLEQVVIGKQFTLDLGKKLETLVYPGDPARPNSQFYLGEMIGTWKLPSIERKVP